MIKLCAYDMQGEHVEEQTFDTKETVELTLNDYVISGDVDEDYADEVIEWLSRDDAHECELMITNGDLIDVWSVG